MTDRILSERAVVPPADCDRFEAQLADYLENALPTTARASADAHLSTCARCRALTDDLLAISRDAAALGPIEPPRDLWAGIGARIEAPVVPIGRTGEQAIPALRVERTTTAPAAKPAATRDRFHFSRRWLAAAASVLVATSVGSTYAVMRVASNGGSTPTVAATTPTPDTTTPNATAVPNAPVQVAAAPDTTPPAKVARPRERTTPNATPDAHLASAVYGPAVQTYDKEIASLRAALKQRADLDSNTVQVLERSLRVIDQAIAESRRALQRDPNSRLLGDQLTRALDQKVGLLRTAVLLPARS